MADNISVTLNVHDRGTAAIKKFVNTAKQLFGQFSGQGVSATNKLKTTLGGLSDNLKRGSQQSQAFGRSLSGSLLPLKTLAATIAGIGFAKLIGDTVQVSQSMAGLERAFKAAAGSAKEGAAEFQFAKDEANRLGLEVGSTASAYKGLLAAMVANNKTSEDARTIFLGVAEASRAMGLSNEETEGTLYAVQQIMSKGKVQAEELTQQLGERFPIAMGVMSEALGKSVPEIMKMMEAGELTADVMIPFAENLRDRFKNDLPAAMQSSTAEINRMKNAFKELQTRVGKGGLLDAVTLVTRGLKELFQQIGATDAPEKLGRAFKLVAEQFVLLAKEYGPGVVKAITQIVTVVGNNLVPVFRTLETTARQVWAGINAGAEQLVATVAQVVGSVARSIEWLIAQAEKAAQFLKFEGLANRLKAVKDGFAKLGTEMSGVEKLALQTRDKWVQSLVDIHRETRDTTSVQEDLAEAAKDSGNASVQASQKSSEEVSKFGTAAEAAAKKYKGSFEEASKDVADAVKDAADKSIKELDRVARRSKEIDKIIRDSQSNNDRFADLINDGVFDFANSISGLQEQLQEAIHARANLFMTVGSMGLDAIDFFRRRYDELIEDIRARIAALSGDQLGGGGGIDVGGGGAFGGASGGAIVPVASTGGSASRPLGASGAPPGSGPRRDPFGDLVGVNTDKDPNGSIVLGGGYGGDEIFQRPPPPGFAGQRQGSTIVIEGAKFEVNQNGLDPTAIDARGLVRAMLPALREEIRRGELSDV